MQARRDGEPGWSALWTMIHRMQNSHEDGAEFGSAT